MNLILEQSVSTGLYTFFYDLLKAVPKFREYTYFVSDLECSKSKDKWFYKSEFFISGDELYEIVKEGKILFVWGVFSAFKNPPDKIDGKIPHADGNNRFWKGSPIPQLDKAEFELVFCDKSSILFIGVSDSLGEQLIENYPDIKDLDDENEKMEMREFC